MSGTGNISMWGNSPALDLLDVWNKAKSASLEQGSGSGSSSSSSNNSSDNNDNADLPTHIVVVNSSDPRHLLRTLAQLGRHMDLEDDKAERITITVAETQLENIARHLMLLHVATDDSLGPEERVYTFLELFGNSLLRPQVEEYLDRVAHDELINLVTEEDGCRLRDLLDVSTLRYRQLDDLQTIFQSWRTSKQFDMVEARDQRLRSLYAERYDHRSNLIDWDYAMRLQPHASIVLDKWFHEWRERGLAYEVPNSDYSAPNRSLLSRAEGKSKRTQTSVSVRGYWADVVNSPFVAYGVHSEERDWFQFASERHRYNQNHVAEYNLMAQLYELYTGKRYTMSQWLESGWGTPRNDKKVRSSDEDASSSSSSPSDDAEESDEQWWKDGGEWLARVVKHVRICFVAEELDKNMFGKKKHAGTQQMAYLSNTAAHLLRKEGANQGGIEAGPLVNVLDEQGSVVVTETARFMLEVSKDQAQGYVTAVQEIATSLGWTEADVQLGDWDANSANADVDSKNDAPVKISQHSRQEHWPTWLCFLTPPTSSSP